VATSKQKDMTFRQKFLKAIYPGFMWLQNKQGIKNMPVSKESKPAISFYSLKDTTNSGGAIDFETLKGKKVLLVNTASNCGYTPQFEELEKLYRQHADKLVIIGFPANDFKEQEKGTDEEIAQFCKVNFGVTFPLVKKSTVIKSDLQNPVFNWLTDAAKNGWNDRQPEWNFSKYLVDEKGRLVNYFAPGVSPLENAVIDAINAPAKD